MRFCLNGKYFNVDDRDYFSNPDYYKHMVHASSLAVDNLRRRSNNSIKQFRGKDFSVQDINGVANVFIQPRVFREAEEIINKIRTNPIFTDLHYTKETHIIYKIADTEEYITGGIIGGVENDKPFIINSIATNIAELKYNNTYNNFFVDYNIIGNYSDYSAYSNIRVNDNILYSGYRHYNYMQSATDVQYLFTQDRSYVIGIYPPNGQIGSHTNWYPSMGFNIVEATIFGAFNIYNNKYVLPCFKLAYTSIRIYDEITGLHNNTVYTQEAKFGVYFDSTELFEVLYDYSTDKSIQTFDNNYINTIEILPINIRVYNNNTYLLSYRLFNSRTYTTSFIYCIWVTKNAVRKKYYKVFTVSGNVTQHEVEDKEGNKYLLDGNFMVAKVKKLK